MTPTLTSSPPTILTLGVLMLAAAAAAAGCAGRSDVAALKEADGRRPASMTGRKSPAHAEVVYEDTVVVFSTDEGVAAIEFFNPYLDGMGVNYRYRFVPTGGGHERRGTGWLEEKYTPVPDTQPADDGKTARIEIRKYRRDGSELFVNAGPVRLEWSVSTKSSGWVYYDPDAYRLRLARARDFESLDLRSAAAARATPTTTTAT